MLARYGCSLSDFVLPPDAEYNGTCNSGHATFRSLAAACKYSQRVLSWRSDRFVGLWPWDTSRMNCPSTSIMPSGVIA